MTVRMTCAVLILFKISCISCIIAIVIHGVEIIMDWKKESEMFDQTAEYYHTFRPSCPMEIIDKSLITVKCME